VHIFSVNFPEYSRFSGDSPLRSFHFSPLLPGKDWLASEAAHEARLAAILDLGPGKECVDVGCGVGGPMRTIASVSGAHVTGITINDYQVSRATHHNEKVCGWEGPCVDKLGLRPRLG
jgi:protein-L-isoaspartate O-methyltransferase